MHSQPDQLRRPVQAHIAEQSRKHHRLKDFLHPHPPNTFDVAPAAPGKV